MEYEYGTIPKKLFEKKKKKKKKKIGIKIFVFIFKFLKYMSLNSLNTFKKT